MQVAAILITFVTSSVLYRLFTFFLATSIEARRYAKMTGLSKSLPRRLALYCAAVGLVGVALFPVLVSITYWSFQ